MTHLDPKALGAAEAAHGKTCGGLLEGRPMANAVLAYLAALPQAEPVAASPVAFVTPETMKDILAQSLWTQGAVGEFRCDNRHGFTVPLYAEPPFASPTPAVSREVTEEMAMLAHDRWCQLPSIMSTFDRLKLSLEAAISSGAHHGS